MNTTIALDPGSRYFDGHFPGRPILPGVAELHLILGMLGGEGGAPVALRAIPHARLRQLVVPGDRLDLSVRGLDTGHVKVSLRRGEGLVANGELILGPPDAPPELAPVAQAQREGPIELFPLDALLPHRPPMRFINSVLHERVDGLDCTASVPAACALVSQGFAPGLAATEAAAQAAALWEALRRWREGGAAAARVGYLVALRDIVFYAERIAADTPFLVTVRLAEAAPPLTHYHISASRDGRLIVCGTIATFLTEERADGERAGGPVAANAVGSQETAARASR